MNTGKVVLGVLAGAIVGAAAGVLLAPDSGKNTRGKIKTKIDSKKAELDELLDQAKAKSAELADKAKTTRVDLADKAKAKYNGTLENMKTS